jgi:hypothetical protein
MVAILYLLQDHAPGFATLAYLGRKRRPTGGDHHGPSVSRVFECLNLLKLMEVQVSSLLMLAS